MFLATILVMNFYFCCCCSPGAVAGCHDKLGVPGTERGPAGGAVAAVGRAAAARADRDIGVRISPANTSSGSAATSPPV